jgi:hypothetical protein
MRINPTLELLPCNPLPCLTLLWLENLEKKRYLESLEGYQSSDPEKLASGWAPGSIISHATNIVT